MDLLEHITLSDIGSLLMTAAFFGLAYGRLQATGRRLEALDKSLGERMTKHEGENREDIRALWQRVTDLGDRIGGRA